MIESKDNKEIVILAEPYLSYLDKSWSRISEVQNYKALYITLAGLKRFNT
jgi:hypothetical protein